MLPKDRGSTVLKDFLTGKFFGFDKKQYDAV